MRAQGSLEYLIIIAAVLVVSSVVVLFATGAVGGQKSTASMYACKQAAVECKASHAVAPNDPCLSCTTNCKDSSGKELFDGAVYCCTSTKSDMIYAGSLGCGAGYLPYCGNNRLETGEQCDGYTNSLCPDNCGSSCSCLPLSVTITSPTADSYTKVISITLAATTNIKASCSYGASTASNPGGGQDWGPFTTMTTTNNLLHSASLTGLTDGIMNYSVNCTDQLGAKKTAYISWTNEPSLIFFDEFSTMDNWSGDKRDGPEWAGILEWGRWYPRSDYGYNNSNCAHDHLFGTFSINHSESTVGYDTINVSLWINTSHDSGAGYYPSPVGYNDGEYIALFWFDGQKWNHLFNLSSSGGWKYKSFLLPSAAGGNPNFIVQLKCREWDETQNPNEFCAVDTFRITGHKLT